MSRLPTKVWIDSLRRAVSAHGDFATVIRSGDPDAGAVILLLRDRADTYWGYSRTNLGDGTTGWQELPGSGAEDRNKLDESLEKQRRYDPDLWILELDVADPARFIVELPGLS